MSRSSRRAKPTRTCLPAVDLVLFVNVYHELAYPYEVIEKVRDSLKPNGRVAFVEYRNEDPAVPIKEFTRRQWFSSKKTSVNF